jgi:hypothetical protein
VTGSPIFAAAAAMWRQTRAEFEIVRENAYQRAADECNGVLLNARGKRADIDPYSLFIGSEVRAHAYASEELLEFWRSHPRLTYAEFERQYTEYYDDEEGAA